MTGSVKAHLTKPVIQSKMHFGGKGHGPTMQFYD